MSENKEPTKNSIYEKLHQLSITELCGIISTYVIFSAYCFKYGFQSTWNISPLLPMPNLEIGYAIYNIIPFFLCCIIFLVFLTIIHAYIVKIIEKKWKFEVIYPLYLSAITLIPTFTFATYHLYGYVLFLLIYIPIGGIFNLIQFKNKKYYFFVIYFLVAFPAFCFCLGELESKNISDNGSNKYIFRNF